MKKILLAILLSSASLSLSAQKGKSRPLISFYTYGLFAYSDTDCEISLQKKYGFETIVKAGCIVSHFQVQRWDAHNRRSERKLNRMHGETWRYKFDEEKRTCIEP